ncbi:hypothetical protein OROGR_000087 [Orobanche gracilis]
MGDFVKQTLAAPIQLTDQVIKAANETTTFKQDWADPKSKTKKLDTLLHNAYMPLYPLYLL